MATQMSQAGAETKLENLAVKAYQLRKQYRNGTEALNGIDLNVKAGELFGLIGPDGAGKTTMLKILSGVMEPSGGQVQVFGRQPRRVRALIGHVTQNFSLYPDLTVEENLAYEAGVRGVEPEVFNERSERVLKRFGLLRFADRLAGDLSGGMKQKLSVSCALITRPRLVLLDEPTTGLDPLSCRELWKLLKIIAERGITTVVATPVLEEAEMCDRVALIYDGKVTQVGTPQELIKKLKLKRLEASFEDIESAERACKHIAAEHSENVVDLFSSGRRLDVLVRDSGKAESEVKEALKLEKLGDNTLLTCDPKLEDVFVIGLREQGLSEIDPPELPRLKDRVTKPANGGKDIALSAGALTKSFGDFRAVNKVSFEMHAGEIFGLLGANGAGKTTTIKMLCGLLEPTSGEVTILGERAILRSRDIRKRTGYMSQKFTLYNDLTIKENFEFYASVYEIPRRARKEKIDWALKASGLAESEKTLVKSLPRGWKQRIAFGCSVMHEPEILILDEPTAGVDPLARRQLWTMIRRFAKAGASILVTTHYMQEAEYCHRLALMSGGDLVAYGTPKEMTEEQPGTIVEVHCDNALKGFQALDQVIDRWRVSIIDDSIRLILDDPEPDLDAVKRTLQAEEIKVYSTRKVPYSLEDAFISVVQRNGNGNGDNHE